MWFRYHLPILRNPVCPPPLTNLLSRGAQGVNLQTFLGKAFLDRVVLLLMENHPYLDGKFHKLLFSKPFLIQDEWSNIRTYSLLASKKKIKKKDIDSNQKMHIKYQLRKLKRLIIQKFYYSLHRYKWLICRPGWFEPLPQVHYFN